MKKYKKILFIIILILLIALLINIVPVIKKLTTTEGQQVFKKIVEEAGMFGILLIFGLQLAHAFLLIIPVEPIEILAGMCYGAIGGTTFIIISSSITSILIFTLVRKFGKKFVYNFFSKEKVEKIENSKIFQNPQMIEEIILILFLIPGTPKDFLVYIAGLLPIKPVNFIIISIFARLPSIISSTIAGQSLLNGNWKISIGIYLITFIVIGIAIVLINKFNKVKVTKEVIDTIK